MEIKFKKVHTRKDLIISAIVLAVGTGLCFVTAGLGLLLVACGVLKLLFYKGGFERIGENVVLRKTAIDVAHSCRDSLKGFLDGKDVEPELDAQMNGGVVRLEVFYNAAAGIAYAQLFDFSSYAYEPATGIVELRGDRAAELIGKL